MFFRYYRIKDEAEHRHRSLWKNKMGKHIHQTGIQKKATHGSFRSSADLPFLEIGTVAFLALEKL